MIADASTLTPFQLASRELATSDDPDSEMKILARGLSMIQNAPADKAKIVAAMDYLAKAFDTGNPGHSWHLMGHFLSRIFAATADIERRMIPDPGKTPRTVALSFAPGTHPSAMVQV